MWFHLMFSSCFLLCLAWFGRNEVVVCGDDALCWVLAVMSVFFVVPLTEKHSMLERWKV